jgi:pimeloyl-ACP methyl ester carboxylesterase
MSVMRDRSHRAPKVVFLPGASGDRDFWAPVANQLPSGWRTTLLSWPGAGDQPHDRHVRGFDDLIALVAGKLDERSDLVAQSMGGVVAIGIALRHPEKVRRLVLVATSGGIDVAALGAADWRTPYQAEYPRAAPWICDDRVDYTDALARLHVPTLLLWGDSDPLSPVSVGRRLAELLPAANLHVLTAGAHTLARDRPDEVARLVIDHLERPIRT